MSTDRADIAPECVDLQTDNMQVETYNEADTLKEVIIGYPDNFHKDPSTVEVVNVKQRVNYADEIIRPTAIKLKVEFAALKLVLESNGIKVYTPRPCRVPDQLTPRDIGFVIGDVFFVAGMKKESRKAEKEGILDFIKKMKKVVYVPEGVVVEGGDIVVDKGRTFVGLSQRTDEKGLNFIRQALQDTEFKIVPVQLKSLEEGEDCLHLDCVFVPVGENSALIYEEGMNTCPEEIYSIYDLIPINREEQVELATNVLSLSSTKLISREHAVVERVNKELERRGIEVIRLVFNEAPKTGGSFRCCTLPLFRTKN